MECNKLDMKYIFKANGHVVRIGSLSIGVVCRDITYM